MTPQKYFNKISSNHRIIFIQYNNNNNITKNKTKVANTSRIRKTFRTIGESAAIISVTDSYPQRVTRYVTLSELVGNVEQFVVTFVWICECRLLVLKLWFFERKTQKFFFFQIISKKAAKNWMQVETNLWIGGNPMPTMEAMEQTLKIIVKRWFFNWTM